MHEDGIESESGEFGRSRWGAPVRIRGRAPDQSDDFDIREILGTHRRSYRLPARPRIKNALGKGWCSVARYLPDEGDTVVVKWRNRSLGKFALFRLPGRGYCWKASAKTLDSHEVTHWRYQQPPKSKPSRSEYCKRKSRQRRSAK